MTTTSRFKQLYDFLRTRETTGDAFSIKEVAEATGYKPSSVKTHFSKKLGNYLIFETGHDRYIAEGVSREFTKSEFVEYMSQKSRRTHQSPADRVAESLAHRAGDAFHLALESYNRPSLRNRMQAFCLLMVDAWEMLLKGELIQDKGTDAIEDKIERDSVGTGDKNEGPTSAGQFQSLEKTLDKSFDDESHPVCKNVCYLLKLNNQREYLLVPDLEPAVVQLFRATGFNFRRRYRRTMQEDPVPHAPARLALPANQTEVNLDVLRQRYGHRAYERAKRYLAAFNDTKKRLDSRRFAVSNEFHLALVQRLRDQDIVVD